MQKTCKGCRKVCHWKNLSFGESPYIVGLTKTAIKKMKTCPCKYCLVISMCLGEERCKLFSKNFEFDVGEKLFHYSKDSEYKDLI